AQAAREAGNSPNSVLAAAASILGPKRQEAARKAVAELIDLFSAAGLKSALDESFDASGIQPREPRWFVAASPDEKARAMLVGLKERGKNTVVVRYVEGLAYPTADGGIAADSYAIAWGV